MSVELVDLFVCLLQHRFRLGLLVGEAGEVQILLVDLIGQLAHLHVGLAELALQIVHQRLQLGPLRADLLHLSLHLLIQQGLVPRLPCHPLRLLIVVEDDLLVLTDLLIQSMHSFLQELVLRDEVVHLLAVGH